jgi:Flp pilus assembly protein TadG
MLKRRRPGGWVRNAEGLAALEFALVAPTLLLILMGSIEFPRAYGTSQRLLRSVRTMADLVARGGMPNTDDVFAAGAAVTFPTDTTGAGIVLTAVGVYPQGTATVAKVCSSVARNAAPRAVGSVLGPPPDSEAVAGARYVMVETTYTYAPIFNLFPALNALSFTKQVTWPMRGTGAAVETILPGGRSCPAV